MPNIIHRIGMEKASPEEVYKFVATREGLASIGLKDLLDGGQGWPFIPRYHRISRWSR